MRVEALVKAQELWDNPDDLIDYWANSSEKIAQEQLVKKWMMEPGAFPDTLADLGCGPGRYAAVLDYGRYFGFDGSTAMVLAGVSNYADNPNVEITSVDIFNFQPDEIFDKLIMIDVAHHQNEPVDSIFRILDLWKANLYYFTLLVGDVREDLHSATIVPFSDLLRLYDVHQVRRTHIHRFDDNQWGWLLLEVIRGY